MECAYSATPLVVVAGTPGADNSREWPARQPLEEVPLLPPSGRGVVDVPVAAQIRARLADLSRPPAAWDPHVAREERLCFHFANTAEFAASHAKPSVLSPLNPASSLSKPLFTTEWIRKYLYFMPTSAVVFVDAPMGEQAEIRLINELTALKQKLAAYGCHLVVLVVGKDSDLIHLVGHIRRQTGLPAKTGVIGVADDFTPQEVTNVAASLFQMLLTNSQDFFANKMRKLREKRKAVAPPSNVLMWDARFTLKLAFCSESKGDNNGALKLYESAYDSLALLFERRAITVDSSAYTNAREVADIIAIKILQCTLPMSAAFDKFHTHIMSIQRVLEANQLSPRSKAALLWQAMQYARFAQLCSIVKQTSAPELGEAGGMPPGIIWLDAAKLFAAKPDDSARDDPYTVQEENALNAQQAYLNAISDLSGMIRAKSYALAAYGDWLSASDTSAAEEAYKTAAKSLPRPLWPEVERHLSRKLNDGVALFTLGETNELPANARTAEQPLFKVSGAFEKPKTFVGREVRAQVTLEPLFPHELNLERLRIQHSVGQVVYEGSATAETQSQKRLSGHQWSERLVKGTQASLNFAERQPVTLEFSITALEVGDVELLEVEFIAGNGFTQRLPIKELGTWIDALPVSPRTNRHLPLCSNFRRVRIDTRPAKLDIEDKTPKIAAVGEQLSFHLEITSHESETVAPSVIISIGDETILSKSIASLAPGEHTRIQGAFKVPASLFQLKTNITYNTSTDTLPVTKLYEREIDIARPFRVNFDLMPELLDQEWPAFFAPTLTLPEIARKWRFRASILSLFAVSDVVLHSSRVSVDCEAADIEIENSTVSIDEVMEHNSHAHTAHSFVARRKPTTSSSSVRSLEAFLHLELLWCRKSSPEVVNVFKVAPVRLTLQMQEPRVLAVTNKRGEDAQMTQVSYHIENATPSLLNFSVSMASSTFFAFQGPKAVMLRVLPFSTRVLKYQLVPLGDGAVKNRRPLPELRVFDVKYRRTLPILSGEENVSQEQGSLFV